MPYALIIQAAISVMGELIASGKEGEARAMRDSLLREYGDLALPALREYVPQLMTDVEAGRIDPALASQQKAVYDRLAQIQAEGGMTLEDLAALNRVQEQTARAESSGRQAILQQMAARGVGGSGAELAAQLSNQQAGAARAGQAGLDIAGMAQRRALDALMNQQRVTESQLAHDYRARQARDEMSRYNLGARDRAALENERRRQQAWEQEMAKLSGKANLMGGIAAGKEREAAGTRQFWSNLGTAGGAAYDTYAKQQQALTPEEAERQRIAREKAEGR